MATIRLHVMERVVHAVDLTIDDELAAEAAAAGYPDGPAGVADYLMDAGGEAEEWYVDLIGDNTLYAVGHRRIWSTQVL